MDEVIERVGIDRAVSDEGRQHDGRAPDHLAVGHHESARQALRLALKRHLGKKQVRCGAADVDADRIQLDAFLTPDELGHLRLVGLGELRMLMVKIDVVHRHPFNAGGTTVDRPYAASFFVGRGALMEQVSSLRPVS